MSGATIREVQARLGHASPAAAYRYQHVLERPQESVKADVRMGLKRMRS